MATFFSGTDQDQLADGSDQLMYFVSLIVNNDGKWCARMGWVETQEAITYGSGTHQTTIQLEEPIKRYYYTELEIVKSKPAPITDPKALRLLELRDTKKAMVQAQIALAKQYSTVKNAAPTSAQLSIEDLILDEMYGDDDGEAYHSALTDRVSKVIIRYITGKEQPMMTVEKVLQLPTKKGWDEIISNKNLHSLLIALDNLTEDGAGIDIFHEIMGTIDTWRSNNISNQLAVLENRLLHGNQ